jgi:hypothetical protein
LPEDDEWIAGGLAKTRLRIELDRIHHRLRLYADLIFQFSAECEGIGARNQARPKAT